MRLFRVVLLSAFPWVTLLISAGVLSNGLSAAEDYCHWQSQAGNVHLAVDQALCGLKGDARRGREVAIDRGQGNCLSCHSLPAPEHDFHGQLGPPLHGVALRYSTGELRLRLIDAALVNPKTIMPGFYRHPDDNHRLARQYAGTTMLKAQQIEDLLAYLSTLDQLP